MTAHTWRGRRGTVKLGPTEHRVARYLDHATRHGWVRVRTPELAERLGLERSEAYRVTARLRLLGLFGISDDQGGHGGGRMVWRTSVRHDGPGLDPTRHRIAWARLVAWASARRDELLDHTRRGVGACPAPHVAGGEPPHGAGDVTFAQLVAPRLGAWFNERRSTAW